MLYQQSLSDLEYGNRKRRTRREEFLDTMDALIPWDDLNGILKPFYPRGVRGRPPRGAEVMLRMVLLQTWFGLSAEMTVDAVCDSYAMRQFMGLNFLEDQAPDASTLRRFRQLLAVNALDGPINERIDRALTDAGCAVRPGVITDAAAVQIRR